MAATTEPADEADRLEGTPHPRHASILAGHAQAEHDLLDAYRTNRLPHAIILGGPPGIGKATLAWRLARFILVNPDPASAAVQSARNLSVPDHAKAAAQIASLSHPDVSLLRREINEKTKRFYTEIRADDVRRTIQLFQRAAGAGGYRICLVDSAEDLNRSSANALLKLIEEPPPASLFLLVAHRPGLILPTIRSRARLMRLQSLTPPEIESVIASLGAPWRDESPADISKAAAQARGSVHGALRLISAQGLELDALVQRLLQRLPAVDWREVHRLADQIGGRDGEAGFDIAMTAIHDWIDDCVRRGAASQSAARLVPYAEVWEKVTANTRETDALNLDKRPLLLTIFSDLAAAVQAAQV
jgi:DNA polymerase-3 subunit delta'